MTGLFWVGTFWPVCRTAARIGGAAAGWFAGLALLATPVFMGHGFINAKDLPFACTTAWLLMATVGCVLPPAPLTWGRVVGLGLAFGAVLAVRPGGWFVGALTMLPLLAHWSAFRRTPRVLWALAGFALTTWMISWLVMIAAWPSAHRSPVFHPIQSMLLAGKFNEVYPVLFKGASVPSNALPWDYYLTYFGLTLPPFFVIASLIGSVICVLALRKLETRWASGAVLFVIWFPMLVFVVLRMNVYDGIRHFLFIIPALAVAAGIGAVTGVRHLPGSLRPAGALVAALFFASSLPSLIRLHPYQYCYFNVFAGERATIHERFETDYWVTSYREAAQWINGSDSDPRVVLAANSFSIPAYEHFASKETQLLQVMGDYRRSPWPDGADFYVATVRYGQFRNFESAPVVRKIERGGILLSVIRGPRG
ncbi:MAG: hypothetical protein ACOYNN_11470 [Terrimicrobiaceae bacterium]